LALEMIDRDGLDKGIHGAMRWFLGWR
jgi:hypothetical protein